MSGIPTYASEEDVIDESGFTKASIERITGLDDTQVTNLINRFLLKSESKVQDLLVIPHIVPKELHLGDGENVEFDLGPDDEEFYIGDEVENLVDRVINVYFGNCRKKKPLPKLCDEYTDDKTEWDTGATYMQPTNENTIKKAYNYSMKFIFTALILKARYPDVTSDIYIDKNIDMYNFMFFRVRSNTDNVVLTVRLYSTDSATYNSTTYTIAKKGKWYLVMLHLNDDFSTDIDWNTENLYHFEIEVDQASQIYVDNLCFCDDWAFTAPIGKFVVMKKSTEDGSYASGYPFYVTYSYDPFRTKVPEFINGATAKFAAARLIDHLLGVREGVTAFEFQSDSMMGVPDKESLYARKGSLIASAKGDLRSYGFGWEGVVVK